MEYEIELLPSDRTVVVVGLAGVGKTTISEWLINKYPHYKLFHTDSYMQYGFVDALQIMINDIECDPSEYKIVEGVQCYRLLREGLEQKFFPHVVINVLATEAVRYGRRQDKNYKQMDAVMRTIWMQYNKMPNQYPPRLIELLNE
jgi:GTPase SAR1 family protein